MASHLYSPFFFSLSLSPHHNRYMQMTEKKEAFRRDDKKHFDYEFHGWPSSSELIIFPVFLFSIIVVHSLLLSDNVLCVPCECFLERNWTGQLPWRWAYTNGSVDQFIWLLIKYNRIHSQYCPLSRALFLSVCNFKETFFSNINFNRSSSTTIDLMNSYFNSNLNWCIEWFVVFWWYFRTWNLALQLSIHQPLLA